ncbi:HAMP domain-containing protein [Desulfoprunum benzoelyticum]|uniref:histidine kinase n=1 Tax=Desulfoprunum benzoelyticum TaxID=1506996 RepID=A0A840UR05_9BACT|nr:ATP-binding protein [Desulfoprunum benzoelyticum]MBB5348222.1 signal transduction histidine kinase [Desulfoprunum benzoelyticum]MBM9529586.1 HAMP domain-containing protein [Desulfoprunum benzoelyticum]
MASRIHLNLRFKMMFNLGCYILGILGMSLISYNDMETTEDKIGILELAYSLNNIILEARRYEKNYLLYNEAEAFEENGRYLAQARDTEKAILATGGKLKIAPILEELDRQILSYGETMQSLSRQEDRTTAAYAGIVDLLREMGKGMTEKAEELVAFERGQIHSNLNLLKKQLIAWSSLAVALGVVMPILLVFGIFGPLSVIKNATADIALGRFNRIQVINTRDEMQQVMEAFNTMVRELERRQDQLVQSQKLSSIGTLTAGVAHQLNNPLNNISTSCQIALDELETGDLELLQRMLKNIDQETLRARDVVKGLLEFSRVQEFSLRTAPLAETVRRAVRLVQSQIPADIALRVDIPDDLVLPMDTQRMQEVFLNMIINAAQAIGNRGTITITATADDQAGEAIIEVRDTGKGIPREIQGRLFDPFYTTKEEGQGTGLGLSVVYGIIQKHQGHITVESSPGEGAAFFIRLPLATGLTTATTA